MPADLFDPAKLQLDEKMVTVQFDPPPTNCELAQSRPEKVVNQVKQSNQCKHATGSNIETR